MLNKRNIIAAIFLLGTLACSKISTIEQGDGQIEPAGTDPMVFTNAGVEQQNTKAASSLQSNFMVSCWKAYGTSSQWLVMDSYLVEYKLTGSAWDGNLRPYWDYTHVNGQYEKYWDYSNFPYRFHALAPSPESSGFAVDGALRIPAYYSSQTCTNGNTSPEKAEPYLVSQVERNDEGHDYDIFASNKEINTGSVSKNRTVAMPFHHLNSKVKFGIYCADLWSSSQNIYVQDLTVKVVSGNFVSSAQSYEAPAGGWYIGTGNSGFKGLKTEPLAYTLLRFDGGSGVEGNNISHWQGKPNTYWLQCRDGLAQIPQEGVKLSVDFKLMNADGTLFREFVDVPVKLADGSYVFDWKSGFQYTYHLVLSSLGNGLDIQFTASVNPWEDVTASLETDLEQ